MAADAWTSGRYCPSVSADIRALLASYTTQNVAALGKEPSIADAIPRYSARNCNVCACAACLDCSTLHAGASGRGNPDRGAVVPTAWNAAHRFHSEVEAAAWAWGRAHVHRHACGTIAARTRHAPLHATHVFTVSSGNSTASTVTPDRPPAARFTAETCRHVGCVRSSSAGSVVARIDLAGRRVPCVLNTSQHRCPL